MYSLRPKHVDFDEVWGALRPSIIDIINMKPISKKDWNYKFSDVYDICVAIPDPLSDRLYKSVKECLESHVLAQHEIISSVPRDDLLHVYFKMWQIYYDGAKYVHNLFSYLNKQYVKSKKNMNIDSYAMFASFLLPPDVKEIGCLALDIWREKLIRPILDQLVSLLLNAIAEDREGRPPLNKSVVHGVILSFVQVEEYDFGNGDPHIIPPETKAGRDLIREFYQKSFEAKFLEATEEYYSLSAQKLLAGLTCSQYMEAVIVALEAEEKRSATYLHPTSVLKVIHLCQDVMINAHKDKLHAVCHDLITNEERKDLRNMYRLLKPVPSGLSVMVKEFEEYVKKKGLEVVSGLAGDNVPQQFVENVLQIYNKFMDMKTEVFLDDGEFAGALDKALQNVVNAKESPGPPKASERLARYTDNLLRKSAKGLSDGEVDQKLTHAIVIFRYIEDKDVFQKYYAKMLTNRLIIHLSVSMDAEEMMINKLKQACGYEFTSKLSRMFTDIGLSNELADKFDKYMTEKGIHKDVNMTPMILQAGSWPLKAPEIGSDKDKDLVLFTLPAQLQPCIAEFEKYYISAHSGRKLAWLYNMSYGEVRLNYLDKQYTIAMGVFQMGVLMCFLTRDSVSVSEIAAETGLGGDLLMKTIRSIQEASLLSCPDRDLNESSVVNINLSMTSKRLRFRLPTPQLNKQAEKETEAVNVTVTQDRKYYMECAIVRIMKTRKVLKHNALVSEVVEQTRARFAPDVVFIKKSIEDLIEKMYIQRTDENDEYQYLA